MSVDLSEGVGRDYTVFNIFKVKEIGDFDMKRITSPSSMADFFGLEQVGIFRSNLHSIDDVSKVLYALVVNVFNQENLRLVIEYNTYGSELIKNLITLYPNSNDFDEETIVRYYHRIGAKTKNQGLRIQKDSKKMYCEKTKLLVSQGRINLKEKRAITEAELFTRNQNGTYSAQAGNDDIMMTTVNVSSFFDTLDFSEIVEEYFDFIENTKQKTIEDLLDSVKDDDDSMFDIF